jgi:hypothetical protein
MTIVEQWENVIASMKKWVRVNVMTDIRYKTVEWLKEWDEFKKNILPADINCDIKWGG